jgi:hypothetical protein
MDKSLNKIVVSSILENIPSNRKPVDYLMDVIGVGRESVYRRMRSEIPFTFDEISKLSLDLGFSIDEIIGQNKEERIFFDLERNVLFEPQKTFFVMLDKYLNNMIGLHEAKSIESVSAMNRLMILFSIGYDHLFKFFYYRWTHQTHETPLNYYFSEVIIPEEIMSLYNKTRYYSQLMDNNTYIIDKDVFLNTIREIQYYCRRRLISEEELVLLKGDLMEMISTWESQAQKGVSESGTVHNYYLSTLNIESNSVYSAFDGNTVSYFWIYPVSPVTIGNNVMCVMHKKWLDSLKKYSTLITQSNEMAQAEFFNKQREYLHKL